MSEYKDFNIDFIERTLKIAKEYRGEYEVTSLINNCLGLIVIPKEKHFKELPKGKLSFNEVTYGIRRQNVKIPASEDISIRDVAIHIRNGLSHGNIEQDSPSGIIEGIRICDYSFSSSYAKEKEEKKFEIEMTLKEFKTFAFSLAEKIINKEINNNE